MSSDPRRSGIKVSKAKSNSKTLNKKIFSDFFGFFPSLIGKKTRKSFSLLISHLLEVYEKKKIISFEERKMIKNITSLSNKKAFDVMTARSDIVAIKQGSSLEEIKKIIVNDGHTRIPVYVDDLDEIIGFIHSKDLSKFLCQEERDFNLTDITRKILFISGSMNIVDLLLKMRIKRVHIAIVMDEYGGVDGLVTIENVLEEIVGDIEDEHDLPSDNIFFKIKHLDKKTLHIGGRVEIKKIEQILNTQLLHDKEEFETIGGLLMGLFNKIPVVGEEIERDEFHFKILDADNRSIKLVEIKILPRTYP